VQKQSSFRDNDLTRSIWGGTVAPTEATQDDVPHFVPPMTMAENQARGDWFTKINRRASQSKILAETNQNRPKPLPLGSHPHIGCQEPEQLDLTCWLMFDKKESNNGKLFGTVTVDEHNTSRGMMSSEKIAALPAVRMEHGSAHWSPLVPRVPTPSMAHSDISSRTSIPRWRNALSWAKDQSRRNNL
jgi:hypothetical protein